MMTLRKLRNLVLVAVGVSPVIHLFTKDSSVIPSMVQKVQKSLRPFEELGGAQSTQHRVRRSADKLPDLAAKDELQKAFVAMAETRNLPQRKSIRKNIMDKLLQDKATWAWIEKTLLDTNFAGSLPGLNGAEARIFAIAALQELARQGNAAPIESTLQKLSFELSEQNGSIAKGRMADLQDLVAHAVALKPSAYAEDLNLLLQHITPHPALAKAVRTGIKQALYQQLSSTELEGILAATPWLQAEGEGT